MERSSEINTLLLELQNEQLKTELTLALENEKNKRHDYRLFRTLLEQGVSLETAQKQIQKLQKVRHDLLRDTDPSIISMNIQHLEKSFQNRQKTIQFVSSLTAEQNKIIEQLKTLPLHKSPRLKQDIQKLAKMCDEIIFVCDALTPTKQRKDIITTNLKNHEYLTEFWLQ